MDAQTRKWREQNKDQWTEYNREYSRKHYEANKIELNKQRLAKYYFKKEWQALLRILDNFFEI